MERRRTKMAYRPVFIIKGVERATNSQVFATEKEAWDSASDRFRVWTVPSDFDVDECDESVNYIRINGQDKRMEN
jgi:hypothetical protein